MDGGMCLFKKRRLWFLIVFWVGVVNGSYF